MSDHGIRLVRLSSIVVVAAGMLFFASSADTLLGQTMPVSSGRKLAPDAMNTIAPAVEYGETFQGPVDLPLVAKNPDLAWVPNNAPISDTLIEKAKQIVFRGDVYCLEFAFKPVRMIEVDVPTASGVQRKTVWYLLYRVRYLGGDLRPVPEKDPFNNQIFATPQSVSTEWVRFLPAFKLDTLGLKTVYFDQVIPAATRAIAAKERVGKPIYDSIEIMRLKIAKTTATNDPAVWGVAMWTDVDPRTDFFSVQIQGLTNAQRLQADGDKIKYMQKTLVLHFSRPGDTIGETQDRIRFGIPALADPARQQHVLSQYGQKERLDYVWDYR